MSYGARFPMFPHGHVIFQREHVRPEARTDNLIVSQLEISQLDHQLSFSAVAASNGYISEVDTPTSALGRDEMIDAAVVEVFDSDDGQDPDNEIDRAVADLLKAEDEAARLTGELQERDAKIRGLQRQIHELETLKGDSAAAGSKVTELEGKIEQLTAALEQREQRLAEKTRELSDKQMSWHETVRKLEGQRKEEEQKFQEERAKLERSLAGNASGGRDGIEPAELQKLVDYYKKVSEELSEDNRKLKGQVERLSKGIAAKDKELEEHVSMIRVLHGEIADVKHA